MKVTKFDHSCFLVEKDGRGVLFDPVEFEHRLPEIKNIDAIVITHLHGDHFQPEVLGKIREDNPGAKVFATEDCASDIDGSIVATGGDKVGIGEFTLEFYGQDHAEILPGQVPCQNIGTVVDGVFANSGDSFDMPPVKVEVLAAPIAAPWMKLGETVEYIKANQPKIVLPAHDALNSEFGNSVCDNWIGKICEENGATYKAVHFGEIV